MSTSFDSIYSTAEQLLVEGLFNQVDIHLAELENMKDVGLEKYVSLRLLKLKNLIKQRKYSAALNYASKLEQFCEDNKLEVSKVFVQFERLEVLLSERKYPEIQSLADTIKKFLSKHKRIQNDEILEIKAKLLYSEAWNLLTRNLYDDSLVKLEESLELYRELGNKYKIAIVLRLTAMNLFYIGELDKAVDFFQTALEIFRETKSRINVAKVYYGIAGVHYKKGELNLAMEFTSKALGILEELDDQFEYARTLQGMGYIYGNMGDFDKALEYSKRCKVIFEKLGLKHEVAKCLMDISGNLRLKGEYDHSLAVLLNYYSIKEELDDELCLGIALDNMGVLYEIKGEFDEAIKNYEKSKEILTRLKVKDLLTDVYYNLGQIYYKKGNYEESIKQHLLALDLRKEGYGGRSTGILLADSLKSLIEINLEMNLPSVASKFYEELQELADKVENKKVKSLLKLSESIILKKKNRREDKEKAGLILEQIIKEKVVEYTITLEALLHLIEILLWKLTSEESEDVFKEVKNLIQNVQEIASDKNSYSLLAESFFLQSQLSLIELNPKEARELLLKSMYIAEDKSLNRLAIKISNEFDLLLERLDVWNEFTQKLPTIAEKLELTHIEEQLNKVIKGNITIDVVEEKELPVLILILDREGGIVFSQQPDESLNSESLKNILTDINHSITNNNILDKVQRTRIQDHNCLITHSFGLYFCYLFIGKSYAGSKKIAQFLKSLEKNKSMLNKIEEVSSSKEAMQFADRIELTKIVDKIFIEAM